jgi:hypothetical protein
MLAGVGVGGVAVTGAGVLAQEAVSTVMMAQSAGNPVFTPQLCHARVCAGGSSVKRCGNFQTVLVASKTVAKGQAGSQ